jgi:glycosyltransferase involved in cell wall biosynthesis
MAAGKAIVASRLGQIEEVLQDGVTALLVEPADPVELLDAFTKLARHHDLRERLGSSARLAAQEYGWTANAQRVVDAFQDLPHDAGDGPLRRTSAVRTEARSCLCDRWRR